MRNPTPHGPSTSFAPRHVDEAALARAPDRPLPAQRYDIDPGAGGIMVSTFSWWVSDLKRLTLIGLLPLAITIGVGVSFATVVGGLVWAQDVGERAPAAWLGPFAVFFVLFAVAGIGYTAAAGGSVFAVEEHARGERTLGAWTCFVYGLGALKRMIGAVLFGGLAYVVATAIMGGALALVFQAGDTLGVPLGAAIVLVEGACVLAFAWVCLRLAPVIPVYVLEERSVIDGLVRAWSLTRGRMKAILGGSVLVAIVSVMGSAFVAFLAWIPVIGWGVSVLVMALAPSLAHTFAFAVYASCLNDEA